MPPETEIHGWLESPDLESNLAPRGQEQKRGLVSASAQRTAALGSRDAASIEWLDQVPTESRGDAALKRARERNVRRLREATASDCQILSKYMPSDISIFFPFGLVGPDDYFKPSRSWVEKRIRMAETVYDITRIAPY